MVTRNDPGLGVFNGDIGITLRPATPGAPLRAYFRDGPGLRSVAVSRLAGVETAFAMTVHKSQGSEFEHTVLVLPNEAEPRAHARTGLHRRHARAPAVHSGHRPQCRPGRSAGAAHAARRRAAGGVGLAGRWRCGTGAAGGLNGAAPVQAGHGPARR